MFTTNVYTWKCGSQERDCSCKCFWVHLHSRCTYEIYTCEQWSILYAHTCEAVHIKCGSQGRDCSCKYRGSASTAGNRDQPADERANASPADDPKKTRWLDERRRAGKRQKWRHRCYQVLKFKLWTKLNLNCDLHNDHTSDLKNRWLDKKIRRWWANALPLWSLDQMRRKSREKN